MPADIRELGEQIPEAFAIIGQNSNLWDFLVNSSLLHVPSMMVVVGALPNSTIVEVASISRSKFQVLRENSG
ncbi:hypothetical protein KFU94_36630 [Chloroflexi bacterium TSY]|nr:hypothetical protein [Chloroflexi bacterium TSY]